MSDSEQCSNRLELDLISLLVNFACELGQIMTRYDFLGVRQVIFNNVGIDSNLTYFYICSTCHMNWGKSLPDMTFRNIETKLNGFPWQRMSPLCSIGHLLDYSNLFIN